MILGDDPAEPQVSVGVRVGQMVHYLPHRPPAFPVGRVELFVGEPRDRRPQYWRTPRDAGDFGGTLICCEHSAH